MRPVNAALVALFVRNDPDHARVAAWLHDYHGRLYTTWPVLTEVCHFLTPEVTLRFLRWVEAGGATLVEMPAEELGKIIRMIEKYPVRPMDLADASLICLCGLSGVRDILSIDTGDFAVFRTPQGKPFRDLLATNRQRGASTCSDWMPGKDRARPRPTWRQRPRQSTTTGVTSCRCHRKSTLDPPH